MQKQDLMREFYINKNFKYLKECLYGTNETEEKEYLARIYIEEKDYLKAASIYSQLNFRYELGRCTLLSGNLKEAKKIWLSIKEDNPATLWGKSLIEFIDLYVTRIPTFFQIRAFLEVDLDAMLNANLITYCENIVNGAHLFAQNNQESYKFIGRVFVNNEYFDLAELFLQKAKDICYVDPEVHFMLAKCHMHNGDKERAISSLKTSLEKGYGYYPAKKMLKKLMEDKHV